jgi:hypothetical protein
MSTAPIRHRDGVWFIVGASVDNDCVVAEARFV